MSTPAPTSTTPRLLSLAIRLREANMFMVLVTSLLIGMLFGAILIIVTTSTLTTSWSHFFSHPGATIALSFNTVWFAYEQIFYGAIVNFHSLRLLVDDPTKANWATFLAPISATLAYATPLIVAGLGLAVGFRSNLFDIGGQGQVVAGGIMTVLVGFSWHINPVVQVLCEMFVAMAAGALLAGLAGVLKAYTGAHEVIVTMMTNYIVALILSYLLIQNLFARPGVHDGASKTINPSGQLPFLLAHLSPALTLNFGLFIAIAAVFAVQWYFNRSKTGFEALMVGQNPDAARTAGINAKRVVVTTMTIAGALLGLAGMLELTGVDHFMSPNFGGSYGFDAITVALLGRSKPWGVFFGALFFGVMFVGGNAMQAYTPTSIQFSLAQVIQAVVVFCVATPALVIEIFRLRDRGKVAAASTAGGWV